MIKVEAYKLITADISLAGEIHFVEDVNEAIGKDWQPLGSPFILREATEKTYGTLAQALVRWEAQSDGK